MAKKKTAKKSPAPKKAKPKKVERKKAATPKASSKKVRAKAQGSTPSKKTPSSRKGAAPKPAPKKSDAKKHVVKIVTGKLAPKSKAPAAAPAIKPKKVYIPDVDRPRGSYGGVQLCDNPKPFPKKSPYSAKELDSLRKALMEESHRLRIELNNLEEMARGGDGGHESHGHSLHIAEHASDLQSTETNIAMRALDEERLAQVEEALMRIKDRHHYGLCVACGEKIGIKRLIAKPHAHLCMDCRTKYERNRRY